MQGFPTLHLPHHFGHREKAQARAHQNLSPQKHYRSPHIHKHKYQDRHPSHNRMNLKKTDLHLFKRRGIKIWLRN